VARKTKIEKLNSNPRGSTRGPKAPTAKARARAYADDHPIHAVDPDALAAELVPEPGARQELVKRIGKTLLEQNEALRVEVLAGSQTAARANNETMRILASLAGLITVGPKPKTKPEQKEDEDDGPEPEFVGADAADDVDLDGHVAEPVDGSG
jgi:hypothetical protein